MKWFEKDQRKKGKRWAKKKVNNSRKMIDGKVVWTTDDVVNVVNVVGDDNSDQRRFLASDFSYEKLSVTRSGSETRLL